MGVFHQIITLSTPKCYKRKVSLRRKKKPLNALAYATYSEPT